LDRRIDATYGADFRDSFPDSDGLTSVDNTTKHVLTGFLVKSAGSPHVVRRDVKSTGKFPIGEKAALLAACFGYSPSKALKVDAVIPRGSSSILPVGKIHQNYRNSPTWIIVNPDKTIGSTKSRVWNRFKTGGAPRTRNRQTRKRIPVSEVVARSATTFVVELTRPFGEGCHDTCAITPCYRYYRPRPNRLLDNDFEIASSTIHCSSKLIAGPGALCHAEEKMAELISPHWFSYNSRQQRLHLRAKTVKGPTFKPCAGGDSPWGYLLAPFGEAAP
jgi:hypothetical protein